MSSGHLSLSLLGTSETDGGSWPTSVNIFDVTDIMWVDFPWQWLFNHVDNNSRKSNATYVFCFVVIWLRDPWWQKLHTGRKKYVHATLYMHETKMTCSLFFYFGFDYASIIIKLTFFQGDRNCKKDL